MDPCYWSVIWIRNIDPYIQRVHFTLICVVYHRTKEIPISIYLQKSKWQLEVYVKESNMSTNLQLIVEETKSIQDCWPLPTCTTRSHFYIFNYKYVINVLTKYVTCQLLYRICVDYHKKALPVMIILLSHSWSCLKLRCCHRTHLKLWFLIIN